MSKHSKLMNFLSGMPDFVFDYIEIAYNGESINTQIGYSIDIKTFLEYLQKFNFSYIEKIEDFTVADMEKVTLRDLNAFTAYLKEYETDTVSIDGKHIKRIRRNSAYGINRKLSGIRGLFSYLYKNDLISQNVTDKLDFKKLHQKMKRPLTSQETVNLLDVIYNGEKYYTGRDLTEYKNRKKRDIALFTAYLGTGCRVSELINLDIRDVCFDTSSFVVTRKGGDEQEIFMPVQVENDSDSATLTASPKIENLVYSKSTTVSGVTEELYNKGGDSKFTDSDITDWTQTGTDTATLTLDSDNNRILYNPEKPGAEYSAEKTFAVKDNAIVTYDVDWYFGSAVGRDGNFEYLQIGNIRLGWTNGYKMFLSTDGGATWLDSDSDGTNDSIFNGANQTYTKNVKVTVNTATGVASLWFDGTKVDDYTTENAANAVKFGFTRAGAAPNWAVPNGIDRIKVSQFVQGEEPLEFSEVKVSGKDDKTATVTYAVVDEDVDDISLIGALYDKDGKLVEIKTVPVANVEKGKYLNSEIVFENSIKENNLKVFMWNSLGSMTALCENAQ